MDPYNRIPVPHDLPPLSLADLSPPQDIHDFPDPGPFIQGSINQGADAYNSPVYDVACTPPDSPVLRQLYLDGDILLPTIVPQNDSPAVWSAKMHVASGRFPSRGERLANTIHPNPICEPNPPPPATFQVPESQELVQHIYPPPDEVGLSGSTLSGLPLPPLRSPPGLVAENTVAPHRAWSHTHTPSSSSALGLQPAPPTSLGNSNNSNVLPLLPHVQHQYPRLSEREAAAVEREAVALRASQSYGHTNQSDQLQQGSTWANNQALAQVGQPPHHSGQSVPLICHSQPGINTSSTLPTSRTHMDPTTTPLEPTGFSGPSPENDPAATPPPPPTTVSNLTSQDPSRQVTGDSSPTEVPIAMDPIAGCKRNAEQAFAGDVAPDYSASEEDVDMIEQLTEESEPRIEAEVEAGEGEHNNLPVFIIEDGQRPSPKKRKLNDTSNTQNAHRGINIRLPTPPSLAGSSRPPAAPTPGMMFSQFDADPTAFRTPATASFAFDATLVSANLPPPVPVFQRDPDAPPSYADFVRDNQPDAEIERWMECTRRKLTYDPSAVPAPPEGFESGKDRKKEGESGEGTSGEKDVEGEGGASLEGEEGNSKGNAGGSGTSKPYEINENTPPNINEGLWCLFDHPQTRKPKYSYAFMARVAILGSPTRRLQLQDIYVMIEAKFPFYRDGNHGSWKNSIRHNLSTNKWFVKCERDMVHEPGYSAMWTVDTASKGGPKKKRERLGRSKKGRAVLAAREAAEKGIIPDPRIVALAIAMKTTPPVVPPGVPIVGSAIPPPKLPPVQPQMKEIPTPVPIAPAPAPGSPPATTPVPSSSSGPVPIGPSAPNAPGGAVERDTPMETDSAQTGGESCSLPAQTTFIPPIVTLGTNMPTIPTSPPAIIEIESADSSPPVPPKKGLKGRNPSKKTKTLDPPLTSAPYSSTVIAIPRRSATPPRIPTPPFMTRPLSNPAPPSQSQNSKTPPVFPRLSVFTQAAGPQATQSQLQPPPPAMPSPNQPPAASTQMETPVQLSVPRPSISGPSGAEEKGKGGRKGFDPLLLQRLVDEKENPKQAGVNKPVINSLFAVPATGNVASSSTLPPAPQPKHGTPFQNASVGTRFGSFGLTKATSFGATGFGVSVDAAARPTPAPAAGGFGGFTSTAGAGVGAGFAAFGTVATGSGTSVSKYGFTPAAFSNQASTSPIKTSNVRGEGDDDSELDRDSDTDMSDELGIDMSARETMEEPGMVAAVQSRAQSQTQAQTQGSGPSVPQPSVTTSTPVAQHPQLNDTHTNDHPTQLAPSGPAPSALTSASAPPQSIVPPPSPPASSVQGTMTNVLPPTSLFYLDAKPRRRDPPVASSSGEPSPSEATRLIKETLRKHVTLDPVTNIPTVVNLNQILGDLQTMKLAVHHNFLPRAPPLNENYRRGLENALKRRKRKHGEPRQVYRGAGDNDMGFVTESDSETEMKP